MTVCYHISGQIGKSFAPCDHDAVAAGKHTNCCTEGYLCLSNGMCRSANLTSATNYFWRIGCTDKTFMDPACGRYCTQVPERKEDQNWRQLIWQCPDSEKYCCNTGFQVDYEDRVGQANTSCCANTALAFTALNPTVVGTASFLLGAQSFSIATSLASKSVSRSAALASATGSVTSATGVAVESTAPQASGKSRSIALPVGLGVGIGVGAVIVACLVLLLVRRRRRAVSQDVTQQKAHAVEMVAESPSEMRAVERPVEIGASSVRSLVTEGGKRG